ncbi:CobW family GTP-binding protein [Candidatus Tokpelaia sp.]|uniref:CobW family GTP-binding protein n=1 Tax=Candidatus Tokpelaia sp. TaxID=2233777 RepID=UPI00123AE79E|nr:GTP-binding protein [Candidatus Tokpelaia sp.]KAA6406208.1 hypothetical protein DPQ22_00685 [Candidatus Tokpelaia sp.]
MLKQKLQKIPVIIVTGFFGAGKTSLLNRLLRANYLAQTGFIINEFGAAGLDAMLIATADEATIELTNGCLCCTIKGDLPDTIAALLARADKGDSAYLRRIIIETTGLSDPAPIIRAVLGAPFLQPFITLTQVIGVLDAIKGEANLNRFIEARRQIAFADKIIISKTDIKAGKTALPRLLTRLHNSAAAAEIMVAPPTANAAAEAVFAEKLLASPLAGEQNRHAAAMPGDSHEGQKHGRQPEHGGHERQKAHSRAGCDGKHAATSHKEAIRAYVLTATEPVPLAAAEYFAGQLGQRYGERILRLKGLIYSDKNKKNGWILQAVQGQIYPPQPFNNSGREAVKSSRLVVIADGVAEEELRNLWESCRNIPAIDRADYAALSDNPLAIPGLQL